jgi:hypothetical protein
MSLCPCPGRQLVRRALSPSGVAICAFILMKVQHIGCGEDRADSPLEKGVANFCEFFAPALSLRGSGMISGTEMLRPYRPLMRCLRGRVPEMIVQVLTR